MQKELNIFKNKDYQYISNFIETKIHQLRNVEEFNEVYLKNSNLVEKFETTLNEEQKNNFNEIIKDMYKLEEYYFAFSYSLGVKYGEDLENLWSL